MSSDPYCHFLPPLQGRGKPVSFVGAHTCHVTLVTALPGGREQNVGVSQIVFRGYPK